MRAVNRAGSMADDDRTTVMSREILPFPKRRAQMDLDEKTTIDVPVPPSRAARAARLHTPVPTIEEQTSIGHHAMLPQAMLLPARRSVPIPPRPSRTPTPQSVRPAPPSRSTPAPMMRAGHDSRTMVAAPVAHAHRESAAPPPPPSAKNVHDIDVPRRADVPSEPPSERVFVRDATPSSPPPVMASAARPRREPVLILAACGGMLGMIFTLGIVVGLIVSLRGKPQVPAGAGAPLTVAAPQVEIVPAAVAAPAPSPAPVSAPVAAKTEATPALPPAAAAPVHVAQRVAAPSAPASDAPARPAPRPTPVAVAQAPAPKAVTVSKKRVAMPSDPDFDAANAANDLARAQLEASLH